MGESGRAGWSELRRRSEAGIMASRPKRRALGRGAPRVPGVPDPRVEEEDEDEVEDEDEDDEDSDEEEDEDDETVDEVRPTGDPSVLVAGYQLSGRQSPVAASCGSVSGNWRRHAKLFLHGADTDYSQKSYSAGSAPSHLPKKTHRNASQWLFLVLRLKPQIRSRLSTPGPCRHSSRLCLPACLTHSGPFPFLEGLLPVLPRAGLRPAVCSIL